MRQYPESFVTLTVRFCLILFSLLLLSVPAALQTDVNGRLLTDSTNGNITVTSGKRNVSTCTLNAQARFKDIIADHLTEGVKLLQMEVSLVNYPDDALYKWLKGVYKPTLWVRSTSRKGRSLLVLGESYSYMSLSTLSIGVGHMRVNVTDTPSGCLALMESNDILQLFLNAFLNNFNQHDDDTPDPDEHVCKLHVLDDQGYAKFQYRCCGRNRYGVVDCEEMVEEGWIKVLLTLVLVIKVLVVLYSPLFLPESLYRLKYRAVEYIHHVPDDPLTLKVVVTHDPSLYGEENQEKVVRLSELQHMEYFKTMVASSRWQQERIYEVKVKEVRLAVTLRRLLDKGKVPVGILTLINNNLFRCRIRRQPSLKLCCETSILGILSSSSFKIMKWSTCLRALARYVGFGLLCIPWLIRVGIFFWFESDLIQERSKVASASGLELGFTGRFVIYFSPLHGFFLVVYVIILVDSLAFGVVTKRLKEKFSMILRQCLRDMRERSRLGVSSWLLKILVWPFTAFGIFGFAILLPYLVLVSLVAVPLISFYLLPFLNLSVRLIIHMIIFMCPQRIQTKLERYYHRLFPFRKSFQIHSLVANETFIKRRDFTSGGILMQLIVITMCLLNFWSLTLLLTEVISFTVEVVMYTFIGVIVNAGVCLQYVSVACLLYLYFKNTFSGVNKLYLKYHKTVHSELMAMKKEEIDAVAIQEETIQQSTAFTVVGNMTSFRPKDPKPVLKVKNGVPQWNTASMLVFLDRLDKPYTPEKFFHATIDLNYCGCPGPIFIKVLHAVYEFSKILFFLIFVLIIVMAFGDVYNISSTNQLLATVVGGVVPFFFSNVFKSGGPAAQVDVSNVQFRTELHHAINTYKQAWPVYDIIPSMQRDSAKEHCEKMSNHGNGDLDNTGDQSDCDFQMTGGDNNEVSNMTGNGETHEEIGWTQTQRSTHCSTAGVRVSQERNENPHIDLIVDISTRHTKKEQDVRMIYTGDPELGSISMLDRNRHSFHQTEIEERLI